MAKISIGVLPETPVVDTIFMDFFNNKSFEIYDLQLTDFNTGAQPSPLATNSTVYTILPTDSYGLLVFDLSTSDPVDLMIRLIDDTTSKVVFEQILNYEFLNEPIGSGEISKYVDGYIRIPIGKGGFGALFNKDKPVPSYSDIEYAINEIRAQEPSNAAIDVKDLNPAHCIHLAREIVARFHSVSPPFPTKKIKNIYDFNENPPGVVDEPTGRLDARIQFESALDQHYYKFEKESTRISQFIAAYSFSQWMYIEKTSIATDILFRFPVIIPDVAEKEINISNLPAGFVAIPPEYAYASSVEHPIQIEKESRYQQLLNSEASLLINTFKKAEEKGYADLVSTGYSHYQVIRLLRSLNRNRPNLPEINGGTNTDIIKLIDLWSSFDEEESSTFWEYIDPGFTNPFSTTDQSEAQEGHSDLVIYLLTQGDTDLITYLDTLVTPYSLFVNATQTDWEGWYNLTFPIEGSDVNVDFLPVGTTLERAKYFAIYAIEFFNQSSILSSGTQFNYQVNTPPIFSTTIGPIQKFLEAYGSLTAPIDWDVVDGIIKECFPDDACAQEWLKSKVEIFVELWFLTDINDPCFSLEIRLSVIETLYGLGITSSAQISGMSREDFLACVSGTMLDGSQSVSIRSIDIQNNPKPGGPGNTNPDDDITYTWTTTDCDLGALLYGQASTPPNIAEGFTPINPGDLVNCIPPKYLSKLGPNAYLKDLLAFEIDGKNIGDWISDTRGGLSFDDLLVSSNNAAVKIPDIDIVNELLEAIICEDLGPDNVENIKSQQSIVVLMEVVYNQTIRQTQGEFKAINTVLEPITSDLANEIRDLSRSFTSPGPGGLKTQIEDIVNNGISSSDGDDDNRLRLGLIKTIDYVKNADPTTLANEATEVFEALSSEKDTPAYDVIHTIVYGQVSGDTGDTGDGDDDSRSGYSIRNTILEGQYTEEVALAYPLYSSVSGKPCAYEPLASYVGPNCHIPYHQVMDVSKTYLSHLKTSRFDLARKFGAHIHGFLLDVDNPPADFKSHLYRLPVNHSLALEYLCISEQEYAMFYESIPPLSTNPDFEGAILPNYFGFSDIQGLVELLHLPNFLDRLCLDCCAFDELLKSGYCGIEVISRKGRKGQKYDGCAACNKAAFAVSFKDIDVNNPEELAIAIWKVYVLTRLYKKLRSINNCNYSLSDLAKISEALNWFDDSSGTVVQDPHFTEQFVALDMLGSEFGIDFSIEIDGKTICLTALLEGPSGADWKSVVTYYLEQITVKCNHGQPLESCRPPDFVKLLINHIDLFAELAGFKTDGLSEKLWHHQFTNIIRFAEVLYRICGSPYSLGQVQFMFTADPQLIGDDPYPQQSKNEAIEYPFNLPDNWSEIDLASLREKVQALELSKSEIKTWTWDKIYGVLISEFGYDPSLAGDPLLDLGKKFFPNVLSTLGYNISMVDRQFRTSLTSTAPLMWNTGNVTPFRYDMGAEELFADLPMTCGSIIEKLQSIRQLDNDEQAAVQNLIYAPRLALTPFALFFSNFTEAQSILIESTDETVRFKYFQKAFATFYASCKVINTYFTTQIADQLGKTDLDERVTWTIMRHLYGDDNLATSPWEVDNGVAPSMTHPDLIKAGAFASLTGINGTGLKGVFKNIDGDTIWKEIRGGLEAYGINENNNDSPIPGIIPAIDYSLPNIPLIAVVRNGFALSNGSPSEQLGGAQGYTVKYKGVLYINESGKYYFSVGAPTPHGVLPDYDQAKQSKWQLTLKRGNKEWLVVDNDWNASDTPAECSIPLKLKEGAYDICFRFTQPQPSLKNREDGCPQPTGWQVKWQTPSCPEWATIPIEQLYHKEAYGDLSKNVIGLDTIATEYLKGQYQPSIRDIRRIAIRLFSGGLLLHGMNISASPDSDNGTSELDYILNNPQLFEGTTYYDNNGSWTSHKAGFDINLLPVLDNYCPRDVSVDQRVSPSLKRTQALFDWFERLWEFNNLKESLAEEGYSQVWQLWHECAEIHQDLSGHLQQFLGIPLDQSPLVTTFYSGKVLSCEDLRTEEWTIRIYEALKCVRQWLCVIDPLSLKDVRPSLWVAQDFSDNGNNNLISLIYYGLVKENDPHGIKIFKSINDVIREHSRDAMKAYLSTFNESNGYTLSELLLTDIDVDSCACSTRLDFVTSMVQTFLNRVRLKTEATIIQGPAGPNTISILFNNKEQIHWEKQYSTFSKWYNCQLIHCYPEDYYKQELLSRDRKSPGFRLFESNLKQQILSVPQSGGITKLGGKKPPSLGSLMPLQSAIPSTISSTSDATGPKPEIVGQPTGSSYHNWEAQDGNVNINFWQETARRLNSPYIRVSAAGMPLAELDYGCHDPSCCNSCGGEHHLPVDEYFFFLIHSKFYDEVNQHYLDWEEGKQVAELLHMNEGNIVYLAWSKIHRGKAGPIQWSAQGLKEISAGSLGALSFNGRYQDSLYFTVAGAAGPIDPFPNPDPDPDPDPGNPSQLFEGSDVVPGFRFDLAIDRAVPLPTIGEVLPDVTSSDPYYFLYHDKGAPRFPKSIAGAALLIGEHLCDHCQYESAKDWLDEVYNPLSRDNEWQQDIDPNTGQPIPLTNGEIADRTMLMSQLDNLLKWAKHLHQQNTSESLSKSKMVLELVEKIMGVRPNDIIPSINEQASTITDFSPLHPGINPRLLCIYDEYQDCKDLLQHCLNSHRHNCYSLQSSWDIDSNCHVVACCHPSELCIPNSPYRFRSLLGKASEYAGILSSMGGALLSAMEKRDQETLTFIRENQANQIANLSTSIKQNLVREADFQVQALEKQLENTQNRLMYYQNLINVGLLAKEQDHLDLTDKSMVSQAVSQGISATASFIELLPESFIGPAPLTDMGGGTKFAGFLKGTATVAGAIAGILSTRASKKSVMAGQERRLQEWVHQVNTATIEIQQLKNQLVAARLRSTNSLHDLNNHRLQLDHSLQTLNYIRDKFTNEDLYRWQERELSDLYYKMYECALQMALQAQKAYNIESGYTNKQFINGSFWNQRRRGLLSGEKLSMAIRAMDKDFMDTNHKRHELTKSISIALEFPRALLQLRYTGNTTLGVSEDLFAMDHPGHYCRMIKTISITIPCVVGPYTNVNASLRLNKSLVRVSPKIPRIGNCACADSSRYIMQENDNRFVLVPGGKDSLATSKAVQDSGYHQLSFQNETTLTFENAGVQSEFCLSMPQEHNRFDMHTIQDVIMEMHYTAKDGGTFLAKAASDYVKHRLPGNGQLLLSLAEQRPDDWYEFSSSGYDLFKLKMGRMDFPYLQFGGSLTIQQIEVYVELADCQDCDQLQLFYQEPEDSDCIDCDDVLIQCHKLSGWRGSVYHGILDTDISVSDDMKYVGGLCFPEGLEVKRVFLLISYGVLVDEGCEMVMEKCGC